MSETGNYQLKNIFDNKFVKALANALKAQSKKFDSSLFLKQTLNNEWELKELKQRVTHLVKSMHENLNEDFKTESEILVKIAPQFTGLKGIIFPEFISTYGLDHWSTSLNALKNLTEFSTSEFAIRHFIQKDSKKAMKEMLKWSKDKNPHIRRLSSEGCRPRLPWSFKLKEFILDPQPILSILENLKADESLYVRKSVANNLNDISKEHPDLVLKIAKDWLTNKNPNTQWIVKHALRTLLKQSHPKALKLFGVNDSKNISITNFKCAKSTFKIGEHLSFTFELINQNKSLKTIRLEYVIHYVKKNNEHSAKVFKLAEKPFKNGTHLLARRHSLKPMTTRVHYPGKHKVDIVANGSKLGTAEFLLKK